MKIGRYGFFAFVLILGCAWVVLAQPRPATVLDYYNLLPEKYFEADRNERVNWMLDRKRGAIIDIKHGFLYAPGDGAQSDLYVALFPRRGDGYLVAVKHHAPDTTDFTYLNFYLLRRKHLVEVTASVLSTPLKDTFKYDLLRGARYIRVRNARGARLYDLIWSGTRFRLRY